MSPHFAGSLVHTSGPLFEDVDFAPPLLAALKILFASTDICCGFILIKRVLDIKTCHTRGRCVCHIAYGLELGVKVHCALGSKWSDGGLGRPRLAAFVHDVE